MLLALGLRLLGPKLVASIPWKLVAALAAVLAAFVGYELWAGHERHTGAAKALAVAAAGAAALAAATLRARAAVVAADQAGTAQKSDVTKAEAEAFHNLEKTNAGKPDPTVLDAGSVRSAQADLDRIAAAARANPS